LALESTSPIWGSDICALASQLSQGAGVGPLSLLVCVYIFLVALTRWLGTRFAFSRSERAVWLVATLLGGVPAVLTLLALRAWPARMACAACERRRVVTRETCEHCGAAFVPPPADGTEIFESASVLAAASSAAHAAV
jgi:hypothetical protein